MNAFTKLAIVAVLLALGIAGILYLRDKQRLGDSGKNAPTKSGSNLVVVNPGSSQPASAAIDPAVREAALKDYGDGMALLEQGKLVAARDTLSRAYFTEALPADKEELARKRLTELAQKTIFSPDIVEGDEYVEPYTTIEGDTLQAIERRKELRVPWGLLAKINSIADPQKLPSKKTIKLVKGPFHAVVVKRNFTMDVYLQREGLPKVFVNRYTVGLGRNGHTPVGSWRLRLGIMDMPATDSQPAVKGQSGKLRHARWDPPETADSEYSIEYGEPDYPRGPRGLWNILEGTDPTTRKMKGYGIHSTSEPASIGKESSLGCIRLADKDIEELYDNLLYEFYSTVVTKK